ncbi:hypothetical protein K1J10_03280 [Streptococcus australis]|uniref:hypothetical protein n=1 Tax=Streptococcus australis TaxID=113107 RepID=UPI001CBB1BBD|nr:hypothetical protein [Streptococcus australis]MBZ2153680.1 hypothetical protein [Streptococcus australis]
MVITMGELKKLQEKNSIQKSVNIAEKEIDRRIELTVLDDNETYKGFSVVVGVPNSTRWSGRGPLFLNGISGASLEVVGLILKQLAKKYGEAGYDVSEPKRIDIGMHEDAPGFNLQIPNQLTELSSRRT